MQANPTGSSSKLRLICVGTGRDGTMSVTHMIKQIYDRNGGGRVMHEYCAREFYNAFSNYKETRDPAYLDEIRRMIDDCPYDSIVGNGYAAVLPIFAERLVGRDITLVHLRRANRAACIASVKKNAELFPAAYGYYVSAPEATVKRIAAFHFDEMPRAAWDMLSLEDKVSWYYDKTHALIDAGRNLFSRYIEVATEELNELATRNALAHLAAGSTAVRPEVVHLNAHLVDTAAFPRESWTKMQWLLGRLNLRQVADDDVYAMEYFLQCFLDLSDRQIGDLLRSGSLTSEKRREVVDKLDRANNILQAAGKRINAYQAIPELRSDVGRQAPHTASDSASPGDEPLASSA